MSEDKVIYMEGDEVRVCRGMIVQATEEYYLVSRKSGSVQIKRDTVTRIDWSDEDHRAQIMERPMERPMDQRAQVEQDQERR